MPQWHLPLGWMLKTLKMHFDVLSRVAFPWLEDQWRAVLPRRSSLDRLMNFSLIFLVVSREHPLLPLVAPVGTLML